MTKTKRDKTNQHKTEVRKRATKKKRERKERKIYPILYSARDSVDTPCRGRAKLTKKSS